MLRLLKKKYGKIGIADHRYQFYIDMFILTNKFFVYICICNLCVHIFVSMVMCILSSVKIIIFNCTVAQACLKTYINKSKVQVPVFWIIEMYIRNEKDYNESNVTSAKIETE